MGKPHVVVVPFPGQCHVMPLMELSHCLVAHGFKITFVNTELDYNRIMAALPEMANRLGHIRLVSLPDGLAQDEDRTNFPKLCEGILSVMPGCLEELITKINESDDDQITCVVADQHMAWAIEVAEKMSIRAAAFWPASVGFWAAISQISKLIEAGTFDESGNLRKQEMIEISAATPVMNTAQFVWLRNSDSVGRRTVFRYMARNNQIIKTANWLLCNSFHEIEPPACDYAPHILTVGPLLAAARLEVDFWQEDCTCLDWLDEHPPGSVVYVGFCNSAVFEVHQFHEVALGLELLDRPFLWSVQPDQIKGSSSIPYPDGFQDRIAARGRVVSWAPQQKVLAHPSIACFLTHCGWNSTLEGLSNGVPLLCWPYFADQFLNKMYISDVWKVGLGLDQNRDGILSRDEIKAKVERLLGDEGIRAKALELKDMARRSVGGGGSSTKNLNDFVQAIKRE